MSQVLAELVMLRLSLEGLSLQVGNWLGSPHLPLSFLPQIFPKGLPHSRHCTRCWGQSSE